MDKLDFGSLNFDLTPTINMAQHIDDHFKEQQRTLDHLSRINAQRDATIMAGARASIAQSELLEEQLKEIKAQNTQLKENYRLLNELYESAKTEAKENAKDAKHNKIFGWISFGIGTLIGIIGIVFGIIF